MDSTTNYGFPKPTKGVKGDADLATYNVKVDAADVAIKTEVATKITHALAITANDFLVASGVGVFVKKTLTETKTILGLGTAASTALSTATTLGGGTPSDVTVPSQKAVKTYIDQWNPVLNNNSYSGRTVSGLASVSLTFGQLCFFNSAKRYAKAVGSTYTSMPVVAMAVATIATGSSGLFLLNGYIRYDTWATFTVGAKSGLIYASIATAAKITQVIPAGGGKKKQQIGYALSTHTMFFDPKAVVEL